MEQHPWSARAAIASAKLRESTVFCVAFSPCARFLVAGSSLGRLSVWCVGQLGGDAINTLPELVLTAHSCCIYTLTFGEAGNGEVVLFTGGADEVRGWRWSALADAALGATATVRLSASAARSARFMALRPVVPRQTPQFAASPHLVPETNGLSVSGGFVHAAMGDGVARSWDLETGAVVREFVGHTALLHTVAPLGQSGELATGSEDGTVRLWDLRSAACIDTVHPCAAAAATTAVGGRSGSSSASSIACAWVAALAVDPARGSNWLACSGGGDGGSSGFVSWLHVPPRRVYAVLPSATPVNALCIQSEEGTLLAVGHEAKIQKFSVPQMEAIGSQPIGAAAPPLYGVAATRSTGGRLNSGSVAVCGRSPRVDVFVRGRAFTLDTA